MEMTSSMEKGDESCGRLDRTTAKPIAADFDDINITMI